MFRIKLNKNNIDSCKFYLKKENFSPAILSFRSNLQNRLNTGQEFNHIIDFKKESYKKVFFNADSRRFSFEPICEYLHSRFFSKVSKK